jgi:hypothetical protein
MIFETLFEAVSKIREYLENPVFRDIYPVEVRTRIEKLLIEMDSVRNLPGIDRPLDACELGARAEALHRWHMENSAREMEAEEEAMATQRIKPKPNDREQQREQDDGPWPD